MIVVTFDTISWIETHNLMRSISCPYRKHPKIPKDPYSPRKIKNVKKREAEIIQ